MESVDTESPRLAGLRPGLVQVPGVSGHGIRGLRDMGALQCHGVPVALAWSVSERGYQNFFSKTGGLWTAPCFPSMRGCFWGGPVHACHPQADPGVPSEAHRRESGLDWHAEGAKGHNLWDKVEGLWASRVLMDRRAVAGQAARGIAARRTRASDRRIQGIGKVCDMVGTGSHCPDYTCCILMA
jgi:hypothetical protein